MAYSTESERDREKERERQTEVGRRRRRRNRYDRFAKPIIRVLKIEHDNILSYSGTTKKITQHKD